MSYLLKWQSYSFLSRVIAQLIGIVQSLVIIRVIAPSEWGLAQIVLSTAGVVGVTQAIGITSAATKEISAAKTTSDRFKVFLTALIIRILISLPFAVFLYLSAPALADLRGINSELITWGLRIMAVTLIIQSFQGVFNSVIAGFEDFKSLFIYQVLRAVLSITIYLPLIYYFGFKGYFYAFLTFNFLDTVFLGLISIPKFSGSFAVLKYREFKDIFVNLFSISLVVYFVKLLHTLWIQGPVLYLTYVVKSPEVVISVFAFALLYSTKLMVFSDSITDVTLPVMSKKYSEDKEGFRLGYSSNFKKTFLIITFIAALAAFWNREVVNLLISKPEYQPSTVIIPVTILAIWSYSQINLFKSSVFVPSKKLMSLVITYLLMILGVAVFVLVFSTLGYLSVTVNLALGFATGTLAAFYVAMYLIKKDLKIQLMGLSEYIYGAITTVYVLSYYLIPDIYLKVVLTLMYVLISLYYLNKHGIINQFLGNLRK